LAAQFLARSVVGARAGVGVGHDLLP
jgi:hypothetical protein